jgi:large subunit ribosomal protein L29
MRKFKNYKEIQNISVEELKAEIQDASRKLTALKFSHAVSPIENPLAIRNLRREVARLKTALRSKEIAG